MTLGIFKDKDLKEEVEIIQFGMAQVEEPKEIRLYLNNDSEAYVQNIVLSLPSPISEDVTYEVPSVIEPKGIGELVLTWTPSPSWRKALEIELEFQYEEVYLPSKEQLGKVSERVKGSLPKVEKPERLYCHVCDEDEEERTYFDSIHGYQVHLLEHSEKERELERKIVEFEQEEDEEVDD